MTGICEESDCDIDDGDDGGDDLSDLEVWHLPLNAGGQLGKNNRLHHVFTHSLVDVRDRPS